jgi:hypothetical protein
LESGGNLMAGGGSLCCDSRERGEFSFIGSGVVEQTSGELKRKVGNWSRNWIIPAFKIHWEKTLETCSRFSPHSYVLATLAYYEGCNVSILLWLWFKASSLMGMSL